jgi:hypothetical protein
MNKLPLELLLDIYNVDTIVDNPRSCLTSKDVYNACVMNASSYVKKTVGENHWRLPEIGYIRKAIYLRSYNRLTRHTPIYKKGYQYLRLVLEKEPSWDVVTLKSIPRKWYLYTDDIYYTLGTITNSSNARKILTNVSRGLVKPNEGIFRISHHTEKYGFPYFVRGIVERALEDNDNIGDILHTLGISNSYENFLYTIPYLILNQREDVLYSINLDRTYINFIKEYINVPDISFDSLIPMKIAWFMRGLNNQPIDERVLEHEISYYYALGLIEGRHYDRYLETFVINRPKSFALRLLYPVLREKRDIYRYIPVNITTVHKLIEINDINIFFYLMDVAPLRWLEFSCETQGAIDFLDML